MTCLDLDDLPPKVAALLTELAECEEVLLVQNGAVVGRLLAGGAPASPEPEPEPDPEARAKEVFELFRASVEDEF